MNLQFIKNNYFPVITAICLVSCGPFVNTPYTIPLDRQQKNVYYSPASANLPLLLKKNDVRASVGYSGSKNIRAVELMGAYAPVKNLGIVVRSTNSSRNTVTFNNSEVGAGFLTDIDANWHFETYTGYNWGKINNTHYTGTSTFKENQVFIQPAISVHNPENNMMFSFVSRFTQVRFDFIDSSFNTGRENYSAMQINNLISKPNHLFWEPGICFKYGWSSIVFNVGFTQSVHLGKPDFERDNYNISTGVTFQFNATAKSKLVK